MARVSGPLLSLEARGAVGDTLLFRHGKRGFHAYKPADPRTVNQQQPSEKQTDTRAKYRAAITAWRLLSAEERAGWNELAKQTRKPVSGWNVYMQAFMLDHVPATDWLTLDDGRILTNEQDVPYEP